MSFEEAIRRCLANFANFNGRASRPEFWYFVLATALVSVILGMINGVLSFMFSLAVLLPSLAVGARRLHDTGRPGWWQAPMVFTIFGSIGATGLGLQLSLIALLCSIPALAFCAMEGTAGANQYGDPPGADPMAPPALAPSSPSWSPPLPPVNAAPVAAKAPPPAANTGVDLLVKLAELRDKGILTAEEFETKKAEILKTLG